MSSGGGGGGSGEGGGRKRKASPDEAMEAPARREPRRGMGVAELERIRLAIEMAERCYAAVSSLSSSAAAAAAPRPPALPPTVTYHHHHRHSLTPQVGNGAVHQLQEAPWAYQLTPYRFAQHYASDDSLTRVFASNGGHPSLSQRHRQADQIQSAVTALPVTVTGQSASSESSSSANQLRQGRRQAPPRQRTVPPQVAFVDLVDSDELDLELKL